MGIEHIKRCKIDGTKHVLSPELEAVLCSYIKKGLLGNYSCPMAKEYYKEYNELLKEVARKKPFLMIVDDSSYFVPRISEKLKRSFRILNIVDTNLTVYDLPEIDFALINFSGKDELYKKLKSMNPSIGILFASEKGDKERLEDICSGSCDRYLEKPFSFKELEKEVTELFHEYNRQLQNLSEFSLDIWNFYHEILHADSLEKEKMFFELLPSLKQILKDLPYGRETGKIPEDNEQYAGPGILMQYVISDKKYSEDVKMVVIEKGGHEEH